MVAAEPGGDTRAFGAVRARALGPSRKSSFPRGATDEVVSPLFRLWQYDMSQEVALPSGVSVAGHDRVVGVGADFTIVDREFFVMPFLLQEFHPPVHATDHLTAFGDGVADSLRHAGLLISPLRFGPDFGE